MARRLKSHWIIVIPAIAALAPILASHWACGVSTGGNGGGHVQTKQHTVSLSWVASTSPNVEYNIYRAAQSSGPYLKLNSSPQPGTTFVDATVQSGVTYYYVVTAVNANLLESKYSNEVTAVVPSS